MAYQIGIDGQRGTIGANGVVDFHAPDLMNVVFYEKAVLDPEQSKARGRPWHRSMTYVRIQHPGEKDCIDRPVAEDDIAKHKWPRQWAAFEKKQEQSPSGTPVECLFPQAPEIAVNLHSLAIHTVEQLAGLTAHGLQTLGMGATQWQNEAKKFLSAANGGAGMHRLDQENKRLANSLEVQQNQIALLQAQLNQMMAERGQGIPPAMIPAVRATEAQAHASMVATPYKPIELSDEPLFIAVEDEGMTGPSIEAPPVETPKRRGRPPINRN